MEKSHVCALITTHLRSSLLIGQTCQKVPFLFQNFVYLVRLKEHKSQEHDLKHKGIALLLVNFVLVRRIKMIDFRFGAAHLLLNAASTINVKLNLYILKDVVVHIINHKVDVDLGNPLELFGEVHFVQLIKEIGGLNIVRRDAEQVAANALVCHEPVLFRVWKVVKF